MRGAKREELAEKRASRFASGEEEKEEEEE